LSSARVISQRRVGGEVLRAASDALGWAASTRPARDVTADLGRWRAPAPVSCPDGRRREPQTLL